jgi:hypothetical protein
VRDLLASWRRKEGEAMASTTDVNIVVAQGNAVSEVQNIRKQVLEFGQHAIAQKAEDKKKEEKAKVQESHEGDKIEIRTDEGRREGRDSQKEDDRNEPSQGPEEPRSSSGNLIDIKV